METKNSAILIIDTQEKLVRAVGNKDVILCNIKNLYKASILLNIPTFITEQNPDKLGHSLDYLEINKNRKMNGRFIFVFLCKFCESVFHFFLIKFCFFLIIFCINFSYRLSVFFLILTNSDHFSV